MKKRHLKIKWKVSSFWEPFFATLIICFVCIIPYMRTLNSFNTIELYQHVYARSSLMLILIGVWPLAKRCDAMKTTIFSGNYCILQKALISGTVAVLCGEACVIAVFEFISSSGQNGDYLHIPVWGFRKSNYSSASPHEKEEIVALLSKCIKTLNQDSAMQKVVQHNEATQ